MGIMYIRGVIKGKTGKATALPKFSDTLTLSQPEGPDYAQPLALPHLKISVIMPLYMNHNEISNNDIFHDEFVIADLKMIV